MSGEKKIRNFMPHSGLIPAHDAVKIQDMLDKMHSDLSHVLVLTKRIGAVCIILMFLDFFL